jgi:hypothetical protein
VLRTLQSYKIILKSMCLGYVEYVARMEYRKYSHRILVGNTLGRSRTGLTENSAKHLHLETVT